MLHVEYTNQFRRDLKLAKRRRNNLELMQNVMQKIANEERLESKYRDHALSGNWAGCRELHIQPDWLLIYELVFKKKTVIFVRTGTHSDLFK